jgi:hypothetical protein
MYQFKIIQPSLETWKEIEKSNDSTCFHTKEWNTYLKRIGHRPYILSVLLDNSVIGYFVGEKFLFGPIAIISAPQSNSGTYTSGLCMNQVITQEERVDIYQDLANWLFENKQASVLQIDDWQLRVTSAPWIPYEEFHQDVLDKKGVPYSVRPTLCVAVNTSEEEIWSNLHYKSCKYSINKAKKSGLYVEEITRFEDIDAFTKIHYEHVKDVSRRHGTLIPKPAQRRKRMKALCESLFPNRVIMLQVKGKDENGVEQIMSSGIYCIDKGECMYWTGASYQQYQKYCPNELMVWEAMRLAHHRGGGILNFGGIGSYKLKFGTIFEYVPRIVFAKNKHSILVHARSFIKALYFKPRAYVEKLMNKLRNR